jgi:hypothetical protein
MRTGVLALLILLAGCGGGTSGMTAMPTSTTLTDAVSSITNMNPAPGTPLQAGQTVTFSGTAGYTLATADVGIVLMTIQDQNNRSLSSNGTQTVVARRGTGDATLSQTITLPDSGVTSVRVFFALAPAGATSTNAVLNVSYPVH